MLGQLFQIIGALQSPNRPPGFGGIATAVSSPNTLLGMDLAQDHRKKYAMALEEPDIKVFREKGMQQAMLGNTQAVIESQQGIAHELQKRGFNPDVYFKTEGTVAQAIAARADAHYKGQRGLDDRVSRSVLSGAGNDPQAILSRTQEAANAGLITPKAFGGLTEMAGSIRGGQLAAGAPTTAERLQQGGGQMAKEGFPFTALPGGFRGGQPSVIDFPTKLAQETALARNRAQAQADVDYGNRFNRAESTGLNAQATAQGQANVRYSPESILGEAKRAGAVTGVRTAAQIAAEATPTALEDKARTVATETAAREAANIRTRTDPTLVQPQANLAGEIARGTAIGREQGKIDVQTQPDNVKNLNSILANKTRTETLARTQAQEEANLAPARKTLDALKTAFIGVQDKLPTSGGASRFVRGLINQTQSSLQTDPQLTLAQQQGDLAVSVIARAIGRHGSQLAEQEQQRVQPIIPKINDTREVVALKFGLLEELTKSRLGADDQPKPGLAPFRITDLLPPDITTSSQVVQYFMQQWGVDQDAAIKIFQSLEEMEELSDRTYGMGGQ